MKIKSTLREIFQKAQNAQRRLKWRIEGMFNPGPRIGPVQKKTVRRP